MDSQNHPSRNLVSEESLDFPSKIAIAIARWFHLEVPFQGKRTPCFETHLLAHCLSGWPKKGLNFKFTTKMVFPKSLKFMNSGSELAVPSAKNEPQNPCLRAAHHHVEAVQGPADLASAPSSSCRAFRSVLGSVFVAKLPANPGDPLVCLPFRAHHGSSGLEETGPKGWKQLKHK